MGLIKNIIFFGVFFCFINAKAQDTLLLVGESRSYGDSNVLRWNTTDVFSFMEMYNHSIIIQRKTKVAEKFETIFTQTGTKLESWPIDKKTKESRLLLAAASVSEIQKSLTKENKNREEEMAMSEDRNFLWSNLSLAADQNPQVANLLNLRFCDKNISKNEQYVYRIFLEKSNYISDTLFFIMNGEIFSPQKPSKITAIENEETISLSFETEKKYSGYFIEKTKVGKNKFQPLNKNVMTVPIKGNQLFYVDSVENYEPFEYRIQAIDFFGDFSDYSDTLIAMGRDRTPPPMVSNLKVVENKDKTLSLFWDKINTKDGEKGIAIGVRYNIAEDFTPLMNELLPITTTSFNWKNSENQNDLYFVVQVFDTVGNCSYTYQFYQLLDDMAPSKPNGFVGKVDSLGVVTLTWEMGTEMDLDGYLVYFANDTNAEFSGIYNTPLPGNIYYDTLSLNMLNTNVYYKIQAVDKRFNRSENSEILMVKRPDILPPVSPIIQDYLVTDTAIAIEWIPSSSIDVVKHVLIRKNEQRTDSIELVSSQKNTIYYDKKIEEGKAYSYFIYAIDDSKNISKNSNIIQVNAPKNYYKPEVKIFSATYDSLKNEVKISWEYSSKNIKRIVLYKGTDRDKVSVMPSKLTKESVNFTDKNIPKNSVYFYAIKVYLLDGTETKLSVPVGVIVK